MKTPALLVTNALRSALASYPELVDVKLDLQLQRPRHSEHGDYASSIAMQLAKVLKRKPYHIASEIIAHLNQQNLNWCERIECAGAGFLNFYLHAKAWQSAAHNHYQSQPKIATSSSAKRILVEFVSTNPTGPLHTGHGRGASHGDSIARLLKQQGHRVETEYYVNDQGRQIDILTLSIWLRYLELWDEKVDYPKRCYQGEFVIEQAQQLRLGQQRRFYSQAPLSHEQLDEEKKLDDLIKSMQKSLNDDYADLRRIILKPIMELIKADLNQFSVHMDHWFYESSLYVDDRVCNIIKKLEKDGYVYEQEGAIWFASSNFGDSKDRVLRRRNGELTYFASDIAYHVDKLERGYDRLINVWGADHHGYIMRLKAAFKALGYDPDCLHICIVQLVDLIDDQGDRQKMTTRGGKYRALKQLINDIGTDASRFFYSQRQSTQHYVMDLSLARQRSMDNPVYYVQYAHARLCSVIKAAPVVSRNECDFSLMKDPTELALVRMLLEFDDALDAACTQLEPCLMTHYLRNTAQAVHVFYGCCPINKAEIQVREMRLGLCDWALRTLATGLGLLGVKAPSSM